MKCLYARYTLRVEDLTDDTRLFKTIPPVIKVESRQFRCLQDTSTKLNQIEYILTLTWSIRPSTYSTNDSHHQTHMSNQRHI